MDQKPLTNGVHCASHINGVLPPQKRKWIIQKFGGTSVGKYPINIVEQVVRPSLSKNRVAVVCSARSSNSKAEGTTNRLLRATREALVSQSPNYGTIIEVVERDHITSARQYIQSAEILTSLETEIKEECLQMIRVLEAAQTLQEMSPRCVDMVMSAGEKLSCRFISALLQDRGLTSEFVDVSEILDPLLKGVLDQNFYQILAKNLGERIRDCQAQIPVITGFFGTVPGGLLEKVGRGYTDLCAALVAVGLEAEELQVWKEVDGIYTADPRKVPTARLLSQISPAEAAELTFYGSEVIHPFTMEQVIRARIPIRIKNVINPRGEGTMIFPDLGNELEMTTPGRAPKLSRNRSASTVSHGKRAKRPTAVTLKPKILVINVHSNRKSLSHGFLAKIFSILDKWRLPVDLITTSEVHVSMALHSEAPLLHSDEDDELRITDQNLRGAYDELCGCGTVDLIPNMAILSVVGKQMNHMMGVAGKMFSTLGDHHVNIEMISQGASEINISCVIEERDADRAINIVHTNLFTFLEQ